MIDQGYDDVLDDYVLTVNIVKIIELEINWKEIEDLTGIEGFVSLQKLKCDGNQLTSLDVTKNTDLTILYCAFNQLTSLNLTKNTDLGYLNCHGNSLVSLNLKNSNNSILAKIYANNNPDLSCIQVDNANDANAGLSPYNSWVKDGWATYSEDCP